MRNIRELLEFKGQQEIHSVAPGATVLEAVTRMVEKNVGAVLVVEVESIKGIMTERDYLRFITEKGRTARTTPVEELMTTKVIYTTPETSLNEAMAVMTEARIRHLPVMDEGKLLGIVSIGDLVKQISHDQEVHIRTLVEYISDTYPGPNSGKAGA